MTRRRRQPEIPLRDAALAVVQRLKTFDHEALWAGGSVRDMLLGVEPKDYDIATNAPPERVMELFTNTRKVGAKFGVVMVRQSHHWLEVATFRTDLDYQDGRHPERVVFTTAQEDAQRRDFTVNGLFFDPTTEQTIDYVNGKADLDAKIIRAIGHAPQRFAEDHLRMLRAVRFAMRYNFSIEPKTAQAIRDQAEKIERISPERIRDELDKMLSHPARAQAFKIICDLDLIQHLGLGHDWPTETIQAVTRALTTLPDHADFVLSLAAMLSRQPDETLRGLGDQLRLSNGYVDDLRWLVAHKDDIADAATMTLPAFKRLLAHPRFDDLLALHEALRTAADLAAPGIATACQRRAQIPSDAIAPAPFVTGEDLIELGLEPSPTFKLVLDEVYDAQLNEELPDRTAALARMRTVVARRHKP